jgi:hypothetical protein
VDGDVTRWFLDLVIPGRANGSALCAARWREPGIHNHDREYGFRACASKSAVADLDDNIAELG